MAARARASHQQAQAGSTGMGRFLAWLLSPLAPTTSAHQRRARMLAWMIAWLLVLMGVGLALTFMANPAGSTRRVDYLALILGVGVVFTGAYLLNAAGRFRLAAWLVLIPAMAQPWVSLAVDSYILRGDYVPLLYAMVPIMLSAFLFSPGLTLLVSALEVSGLALVAFMSPAAHAFNWSSAVTLVLVTAAISLLGAQITRRDMLEIDAQARRLEENETLLRELATHDSLTGLHNRRFLESNLAREISRAERTGETIGVIALDADTLKEVNDRSGHAAGDAVLRELGRVVSAHARQSDLACRCGGDEFVLVLPGASLQTTLDRAELLRRSIQELSFEHVGAHGETITASLGVAIYPADATDWRALLVAADEALYQSKHSGRNCVSARS